MPVNPISAILIGAAAISSTPAPAPHAGSTVAAMAVAEIVKAERVSADGGGQSTYRQQSVVSGDRMIDFE